jgi:hypothetical protein
MAESIRPGSSTEVAEKVGKDLGGIAFLKTLEDLGDGRPWGQRP